MRRRLSIKKIILNTVPVLLLLALIYYVLGYSGVVAFDTQAQVYTISVTVWTIVYFITLAFAIGVLLMDKGDPVKTLSWIIVMLIIPGFGMIFYNFFGASFKEEGRPKRDYDESRELVQQYLAIIDEVLPYNEESMLFKSKTNIAHKNIAYLLKDPGSTIFTNTHCELLIDGPETFKRLKEDLKHAQEYIHLEYFIWTDDELGQEIKSILIDRAKAGVEIRILLDGIGSSDLSSSYISQLCNHNIRVEVFRPMWKTIIDSYSNFRNHRKIAVIDGKAGYTGGINVDGKYITGDPDLGDWHDAHVRLTGDAVLGLQMTFLIDWYFQTKEKFIDKKYFPLHSKENNDLCHIVTSGHQSEWDGIKQAYINSFYNAKEYLYLITPYLSPNETLINGIKTAALSGIDTRLLIPIKGDSHITQSVTMSYAEILLDSGVRVYQYEEGFVHSKLMVSDDEVATVGSANLDIRSMDQNLEINVFSYEPEFIEEVKQLFLKDLESSRELSKEYFDNFSWFKKFKLALFRLLAPLL
ncbi:MAG: cardiolipin synthase [Saprospiraceae bacterium]|nr:cardiolipin synthase [Saprospiraceae bacterium]